MDSGIQTISKSDAVVQPLSLDSQVNNASGNDADIHVHHGYAHEHEHGHGHSVADANAEYFDQGADEYENIPGAQELMEQISAAILRASSTLDGDETSILDFACGIGMLSRKLAPYAKSIVGVDISKRSVEIYNQRATTLEHPCKMKAVVAELEGVPGELDDAKFDVAVCSMAYHHFEFPERITKILAHFLRPGGRLFVVDLMGQAHKSGKGQREIIPNKLHGVVPKPHGFIEADIRAMFESAGLEGLKYNKAFRAPMPMRTDTGELYPEEDRMVDVFLAEGTKPTGVA